MLYFLKMIYSLSPLCVIWQHMVCMLRRCILGLPLTQIPSIYSALSVPLYIGCVITRQKDQKQQSAVIQSGIITGWITLIMLLATAHTITHLQFFRLVLFTHE